MCRRSRAIKFVSVRYPIAALNRAALAGVVKCSRGRRKNNVSRAHRWKRTGENAGGPREKCASAINAVAIIYWEVEKEVLIARAHSSRSRSRSHSHSHSHSYSHSRAFASPPRNLRFFSSPFTIFIDTKCENSSPCRRHLRYGDPVRSRRAEEGGEKRGNIRRAGRVKSRARTRRCREVPGYGRR